MNLVEVMGSIHDLYLEMIYVKMDVRRDSHVKLYVTRAVEVQVEEPEIIFNIITTEIKIYKWLVHSIPEVFVVKHVLVQ